MVTPSKQPPRIRPLGSLTPDQIAAMFDEAREQSHALAVTLRRVCTPTAADLATRVR